MDGDAFVKLHAGLPCEGQMHRDVGRAEDGRICNSGWGRRTDLASLRVPAPRGRVKAVWANGEVAIPCACRGVVERLLNVLRPR
ncbi:hypothetical protein EV662_10639 [Rhodovulum marinum]|uniref:Uncharacterized protein n=1 Tax=Rhodovulum marinum TaxID=320662 RepID=A0A4V2SQZ5_9RHOB|nr:hypothetical protein EV662_10639 [Rhodovulum marinum]